MIQEEALCLFTVQALVASGSLKLPGFLDLSSRLVTEYLLFLELLQLYLSRYVSQVFSHIVTAHLQHADPQFTTISTASSYPRPYTHSQHRRTGYADWSGFGARYTLALVVVRTARRPP